MWEQRWNGPQLATNRMRPIIGHVQPIIACIWCLALSSMIADNLLLLCTTILTFNKWLKWIAVIERLIVLGNRCYFRHVICMMSGNRCKKRGQVLCLPSSSIHDIHGARVTFVVTKNFFRESSSVGMYLSRKTVSQSFSCSSGYHAAGPLDYNIWVKC